MKITVPKNLEGSFIAFLDIAQASFTDTDILKFTPEEKETLKFVEGLIGENRAKRYATDADKKKASAELNNIISSRPRGDSR